MSTTTGQEDPLIGAVIDGKYSVVELLGKGGMGAVYKARHNFMERQVAIKVLNLKAVDTEVDEYVRRFQREAQTASQIRHPSAVTIYDYGLAAIGNDAKAPYLVMELIEGVTLKSIIKQGRLSPERILPLFVQICGALHEAHLVGIIHRDLKPDNIMISSRADGSERAHVLDFGIAKIVRKDADAEMTRTGGILGTPRYMAPEQVLSKPVDQRTDIYALGLVLYEALSGNVPFDCPSLMELAVKHVSEEPEPLLKRVPDAGLPKTLERVVMSALAKEPERRPPTVQAFISELLTAYPIDVDARGGSSRKGVSRALTAAAGAFVLLAAAAGFYVMRDGDQDTPPPVARKEAEPPKVKPDQPAPVKLVPASKVDSARDAFEAELRRLTESQPAVQTKAASPVPPVAPAEQPPQVEAKTVTAPPPEKPVEVAPPKQLEPVKEQQPPREEIRTVSKEQTVKPPQEEKRGPSAQEAEARRAALLRAQEEAARIRREAQQRAEELRAAELRARTRELERRAREAEERRLQAELQRRREEEAARAAKAAAEAAPDPAPRKKIRRRCGPNWCPD